MTMTDPIADYLTRIRNALMAGHEEVEIPKSRIKLEITRILKEEGYIEDYNIADDDVQGTIKIFLKYADGGERVIRGLCKVSTSGRRVYRDKNTIPDIRYGLGVCVVSTSKGIMTGEKCKKLGIGGEVLCEIW